MHGGWVQLREGVVGVDGAGGMGGEHGERQLFQQRRVFNPSVTVPLKISEVEAPKLEDREPSGNRQRRERLTLSGNTSNCKQG